MTDLTAGAEDIAYITETKFGGDTPVEKEAGNEAKSVGDQSSQEKQAGWTIYLVYSVLVSVMGAPFMYGYNSSVVNAPYDVMRAFVNESFVEKHHIFLSETDLNIHWSLVVSLFVVGGIIGSVWFPERAAHLFGR